MRPQALREVNRKQLLCCALSAHRYNNLLDGLLAGDAGWRESPEAQDKRRGKQPDFLFYLVTRGGAAR